MGMEGCCTCLRWFVFVLNFLFWIFGMAVLGIGLWLRFDPHVVESAAISPENLDDYYVAVYLLIVIGVLMAFLGFFGCLGALRRSQCMLVTFFIVLLIVFCCQLACGILAWIYQDEIRTYIDTSMRSVITHQYGMEANEELTKTIDNMQQNYQCCGVRSYVDWGKTRFASGKEAIAKDEKVEAGVGAMSNTKVPLSCCNDEGTAKYGEQCGVGVAFETTPQHFSENFLRYIYSRGCSDLLYETLNKNLNIIIGLAIGVGVFQLIGMFLSMLLCCRINFEKEREDKSGGY